MRDDELVAAALAGDAEAFAGLFTRHEARVRAILERMIEEDRYCIDVLTQVAAVKTALEGVAAKLLEDHVTHCVAEALASGDPDVAGEKSEELLAAVQRFSRTR